jgi:hypothetical protein
MVAGCADESANHTCSDPLGAENNLINNSINNYNNSFFCFAGKSSDSCSYNKCFQLYSTSSPQVIRSIYFTGCSPASTGSIADMGLVKCLGDVSTKPASGYFYSLVPNLHHGYVVSFPDGTFGRFFIESFVKESGQITQLNMTRQYPF